MMTRVLERELEERIHHELPHLSPEEVYDLACVVGRLVERFRPERVYVFGSQARGEPTPDSDLDLLVAYRRLTNHLTYRPKRLIGLWPRTPWHSTSWSCRAMSSSAAAGPLPRSRPQCCARDVYYMQPEALEEARDWRSSTSFANDTFPDPPRDHDREVSGFEGVSGWTNARCSTCDEPRSIVS